MTAFSPASVLPLFLTPPGIFSFRFEVHSLLSAVPLAIGAV